MSLRWRAKYVNGRFEHGQKHMNENGNESRAEWVANGWAEKTGWVTDSVWLLTFHVSFLVEAGERLVSPHNTARHGVGVRTETGRISVQPKHVGHGYGVVVDGWKCILTQPSLCSHTAHDQLPILTAVTLCTLVALDPFTAV
jgi:hypothetical protein